MSARNGDKSRFQINRKRAVLRRAAARTVLAGGATAAVPANKRPAKAKTTPPR